MPLKKKAVTLLSGGLDSTVALALAQRDNLEIVLSLTFDYGQRARQAEVRHSRRVAEYFSTPSKVISLPWFLTFQRSGALVDANQLLPHPSLSDLSNPLVCAQSAETVWVPNRNGVFLEVAASFAEELGAKYLVVGFNREEAATFPDNSEKYLAAINQALAYSTANHVSVLSPTAPLNKTQIVKQLLALKIPHNLIWSCYREGNAMCGECESCMRLKRAFKENEVDYEPLFEDSSL